MKKVLCLILMVMFLFLAVGTASADYIRGSTGDKLETYTSTATEQGIGENVSLSTIPVGTRILGFTVMGYGGAGFVALYDTATMASATASNVIVEGAAASGTTESVWFSMPYTITERLYIAFVTSYTSVTIYYE